MSKNYTLPLCGGIGAQLLGARRTPTKSRCVESSSFGNAVRDAGRNFWWHVNLFACIMYWTYLIMYGNLLYNIHGGERAAHCSWYIICYVFCLLLFRVRSRAVWINYAPPAKENNNCAPRSHYNLMSTTGAILLVVATLRHDYKVWITLNASSASYSCLCIYREAK